MNSELLFPNLMLFLRDWLGEKRKEKEMTLHDTDFEINTFKSPNK